MYDVSSDAEVSARVIARSIQLRLYGREVYAIEAFCKTSRTCVFLRTRLGRRNFEAYVRAEARQRRKQPALFLPSHCNNNGDVCYFAQTASTLAQGWRRNESCCETAAVAMIHRKVFFFFFFSSSPQCASPRSFHEHVLFLPRLAGDRPFSLTRSARIVNVIRDRSWNAAAFLWRCILSSAAD